ncbi:MAG: flagellar hook-length control protein FliK [Pseudomonadota bacterium]
MNIPILIQSLFNTNTNRAGDISKGGQSTSGKTGAAGVFEALMRKAQNVGNDVRMSSRPSPVALKGHALIAHLKNNLRSSGVSLDQSMADDSALAGIKKVLLGAGFEAGQVKNLLSELKINAGGNGVRVATLFEGISRLTEPPTAKSKPTYLDISLLPHIETLLAKFELTPDQIKTALSAAKVEGKGIDAERLASELKLLRKGTGSRKDISQDDVDRDQVLSMMQQIGLTFHIKPAGPLNLESLVTALEKVAGRNSSTLDTSASVMTDANKSTQSISNHLKQLQGHSISGAALQNLVGCDSSTLDQGVSVTAEANKGNPAVLNHLKQLQGQSISSSDGRFSQDQFAARLEMAAGLQQDSAAVTQGLDGDWNLFVSNIKTVSTGGANVFELRTGALLTKDNTSNPGLIPGLEATVSRSEVSNSLFSGPAFFKPVSGKRGLVEKGSNSQGKPGQTTGLSPMEGSNILKTETLAPDNVVATHSTAFQPVFSKGSSAERGENSQNPAVLKRAQSAAGSPDATKVGGTDVIKANVSAGQNLEAAIAALADKTGEPAGEALVKPGRTVRKSTDFAVSVLGDGINRHAETLDSAPSSTPDRPAGRMLPQYLLDQVSRQILRSRFADESEILIQLKPPSLGRLKMSIENTAEGLKVSIIAESQAARDMLLSNSGDLKTALMDQGIRLDKIDVETQADFNQTMADTRHGSEGSNRRKGSSGGNHIRVETAASAIEIPKLAQNGSSVLNLVA